MASREFLREAFSFCYDCLGTRRIRGRLWFPAAEAKYPYTQNFERIYFPNGQVDVWLLADNQEEKDKHGYSVPAENADGMGLQVFDEPLNNH